MSLHYTKFGYTELQAFVANDLSKNAQRLYLCMRLNCNVQNGLTHPKTDDEYATELSAHRTTILRARAELEDSGMIESSKESRNHKQSYVLIFVDGVNSTIDEKSRQKQYRQNSKKYAAERTNIEQTLGRRLNHSEIKRLKEKYGI